MKKDDFYVSNAYGDGDKDLYIPAWRQILINKLTKLEDKSISKYRENLGEISENEISIKHPKTQSIVRAADDGNIELFCSEDTGIILNKEENSIDIFADKIRLISKETSFYTKPDGLCWNGLFINPEVTENRTYFKEKNRKEKEEKTRKRLKELFE